MIPFALAEGQAGVDAEGRRGRDFADARAKPDVNVFDALKSHIEELQKHDRRCVVAGYSQGARDRLLTVLRDHGIERVEICESWEGARRLDRRTTALIVLGIETGFAAPDVVVITEQDILGDRLARPTKKRKRSANFIAELSSLSEGDLVVHVDHGIGRYDGLETLTVTGAPHDCLRLIYEGGDKLYLPVENIELLSRYGSAADTAQLDKLGGVGWQGRKARVKKRLKDMAEALLKIAAERELRRGQAVSAPDGIYAEFAARFPYPETEDQLRVIEEVLEDLAVRPADGPAGLWRCRFRQDRGGVARGLHRGAVGDAGRGGGADDAAGASAFAHFREAVRRAAGARSVQLSRLVTAKDQKRPRMVSPPERSIS